MWEALMTKVKRITILTLIVFSLLCLVSVFVLQNKNEKTTNISAEAMRISAYQVEEREISPSEIDVILYMELMFLRDGVYPTDDKKYVKLKTTDFSSLSVLELNDVRQGTMKMTDVSGLGLFDFSNLRELYLKNNSLTKISAKTFWGMTQLDVLDLTGNELETLDIGNLTVIGCLKAPNNKLRTVDLSNLAEQGDVDLSFNLINDINSLKLKKNGQNAKVDLYGNYIKNFKAENFENYDMIVGFQNQTQEYNETTLIKLYKFDSQEFWIECQNDDMQSTTAITSSATLAPATYQVRLRDVNGYYNYETITIVVKKSPPTIMILNQENQEVDYSETIKEKIEVKFFSNDSNYVVEYSINGGNYIKGNTVNLEKSGSYSFIVRSVNQSGEYSQNYSFTVQMTIRKNNILQILAIAFSIMLVVGVGYAILSYYNRKAQGKYRG